MEQKSNIISINDFELKKYPNAKYSKFKKYSLGYSGVRPRDVHEGWIMTLSKWTFLSKQPINYIVQDGGAGTCGLCRIFLIKEGDCHNCPLYQEWGHDCTVYFTYSQYYDNPNPWLAGQFLKELKMIYRKWRKRYMGYLRIYGTPLPEGEN